MSFSHVLYWECFLLPVPGERALRDNGNVVQYSSLEELLKNPSSFSFRAHDAGIENANSTACWQKGLWVREGLLGPFLIVFVKYIIHTKRVCKIYVLKKDYNWIPMSPLPMIFFLKWELAAISEAPCWFSLDHISLPPTLSKREPLSWILWLLFLCFHFSFILSLIVYLLKNACEWLYIACILLWLASFPWYLRFIYVKK